MFQQNVGQFVIALRVANYQVNVAKINEKIKSESQRGEHQTLVCCIFGGDVVDQINELIVLESVDYVHGDHDRLDQ